MSRNAFRFNRREFIKSSLASAAAASAVSAGLTGRARAADRPLVVATWGGFFEEVMSEFVYPPFVEQTGIEVESVPKAIGDAWLVQLDQAKRAGETLVDVSGLIDIPMERGQTSNLWQPIESAKMPNLKNLTDLGKHHDKNGVLDGVSWGFYYIVLVSNKETFPEQPTSWKILWDPATENMAGVMAQPDVGFLLDITAQTWFGGPDILSTKEGVLEVLGKIEELKPNVKLWFRDEAQFQQGLESGEIPIGLYYNDVANHAISQGIPIHKTWPAEGAVLNRVWWGITGGTPLNDEAQAFLNYTLSPAAQEIIAREVGISPSIPRSMTNLTDEEWYLVTTDDTPIVPKYDLYVKWGDWLNDRWTETITGF